MRMYNYMRSVKDGFRLQGHAVKCGFMPTVFASNQLILHYSKNGLIREAHKVFVEMFERNVYTWNAILNAHIRAQNLSTAQGLFDTAPLKDSVTYNSMISGYANSGGYEKQAINLFYQMQHASDEARIDEFTLTTMLNLVAKTSHLSCGQQLHSLMLKGANDLSGFAVSSLVDMYSKCGSFHYAWRVFDRHCSATIDVVSKNAMVAACCREHNLESAKKIFWCKPELNDTISWNTIISGLAQNGQEEEAIKMFKRMEEEGFRWNEHTLASILTACFSLKSTRILGKEIHAWVLKGGMISNPFISSAIVDLYSKFGHMKYAESVYAETVSENSYSITSLIVGYSTVGDMLNARKHFDSLKEKNYVVWTAMISGYVRQLLCNDVFDLFRELVKENARSYDALILVNLLNACTILASIDPGKQIHAFALRSEMEIDVKMTSALIDMYSKCGNINYSKEVFRQVNYRDIVIYNVMIAACAHHGYVSEATQLFEEMVKEGFKPDVVTFVAILCACRHCGLIDLGEKYFSCMTEDYGLSPGAEHYACMIDLYGRANQLDKALEFIKIMPVQLDTAIMGTFINACKTNRNVEFAKAAEDMLLEIEGNNGARYVQLAETYALEGMWDEKGRIMKKMRSKKVKKHAGCSWLHIAILSTKQSLQVMFLYRAASTLPRYRRFLSTNSAHYPFATAIRELNQEMESVFGEPPASSSLGGSSENLTTTHDFETLSPASTHSRKHESLPGLTHTDIKGEAQMVDITSKNVTERVAIATCKVILGKRAYDLVSDNQIQKGDVLNVAKIAGISGAKQTRNLIPLCHNIPLDNVRVDLLLSPKDYSVEIVGEAASSWKTGVEMEAMTAAAVAGLTVYDMCKAVSKDIRITDIKLERKTGGKSGDWFREENVD